MKEIIEMSQTLPVSEMDAVWNRINARKKIAFIPASATGVVDGDALFKGYLDTAEAMLDEAQSCVVEDESDVASIETAKLLLVATKKLAKQAESERVVAKAPYLAAGQSIDGAAKGVKALTDQAVRYLETQARFVELKRAAEEAELFTLRTGQIRDAGGQPETFAGLRIMTAEQFGELIAGVVAATAAKKIREAEEFARQVAEQEAAIEAAKEAAEAREKEVAELRRQLAEAKAAQPVIVPAPVLVPAVPYTSWIGPAASPQQRDFDSINVYIEAIRAIAPPKMQTSIGQRILANIVGLLVKVANYAAEQTKK